MVLVLNDEEFFEGLLGATGWILGNLYFKKQQKADSNPLVVALIAWCFTWFTRKIGMRAYRSLKPRDEAGAAKQYALDVPNVTTVDDNMFRLAIIGALLVVVYLMYMQNSPMNNLALSSENFTQLLVFGIIAAAVYMM